MNLPTGIRGRIVAVSLLLIVAILLADLVAAPLIQSYLSVDEEIEALQDDIIRYRRIIAQLPGLKASMSRFENEEPLAPFLLAGRNHSLAAAGLQRRLQEIAELHGVRVISVRVQSPVSYGPLEQISVQARLSGDTPGLKGMLYDLEASRPYLFVDSLTISARPARRGVATDALDARISLSGLREPDLSPSEETSSG